MDIPALLEELGIVLPVPVPPVAAYVPFVQTGNLVTISGQLPMDKGTIACKGRLGDNISIEEAAQGTRLCAIHLLSQLNVACAGDLSRVVRCVRLGGFIAATAEFTDHAKVMNGASELIQSVFGEAGRHARSTIGVASLPLGAAVEVEGLFEIR